MGDNDDPLIEVLGKTGKPKKVHLFDLNPSEHINRNDKTGKFEPYITRWYRLPGEYNSEYDAYKAISDFMNKYYLR